MLAVVVVVAVVAVDVHLGHHTVVVGLVRQDGLIIRKVIHQEDVHHVSNVAVLHGLKSSKRRNPREKYHECFTM